MRCRASSLKPSELRLATQFRRNLSNSGRDKHDPVGSSRSKWRFEYAKRTWIVAASLKAFRDSARCTLCFSFISVSVTSTLSQRRQGIIVLRGSDCCWEC